MSIVFLVLGSLLLLSPFIGIGIYIIHESGLEAFLWVFGRVIAIIAVVSLGVFLVMLGSYLTITS